MIWGRSTSRDDRPVEWLRRSTWRASLTSGIAAVLAAALVSGSRDPVADVLAGAQGVPQAPTSTAQPVPPPATGPHLPWPTARSTQTPASTSRRTTPAALVDATDIPLPALVAYQRAATVIDAADPTCRLDWALLAAIGRVESDHGRFGGSSLDAQGVDRPAVLGPRLDGRHGMAVVRDTDAGRLDHDRRYDRAVGPMQFLPATWAAVAVDGDSDGRRDVQDIDDAALGSAVYLCVGADDLSTGAGQRAAVYRYNHSTSYVTDVLAIARAYRSGSPFLGLNTLTEPTGTLLPTRGTRPNPDVDHQHHPLTPTSAGPSSTPTPSGPTTGPTEEPTDGPTDGPSDLPTASPVPISHGPLPTGSPSPSEPTNEPTTDPTDTPSPSDPTATASPTDPPSDPPIVPENRPAELAGLTEAEVRAINAAWPICSDRLANTWTDDEALGCLSTETGIPQDDADLVAFVHWLGRHEADASS